MILLFVNILILGELLQDVSANEQGNFANVINNNNINGWNKDVRKIRNVVSKVPVGCNPDFIDVHGSSCKDYSRLNFCTSIGGYGIGWNAQIFGGFENYSVNAETAWSCPECGCIDIHLAISNSSINVTEENACEDTESWCILTSQFECNDDRISQKCPKTCTNECLSTIEPTCEDTEPWCVFIGKFECKDNLVKEKCSNACHQCNASISTPPTTMKVTLNPFEPETITITAVPTTKPSVTTSTEPPTTTVVITTTAAPAPTNSTTSPTTTVTTTTIVTTSTSPATTTTTTRIFTSTISPRASPTTKTVTVKNTSTITTMTTTTTSTTTAITTASITTLITPTAATTIKVPINCEWSEWHAGKCSKTCGSATRLSERFKTVSEQNGGNCSGISYKVEKCNLDSCPGSNICPKGFSRFEEHRGRKNQGDVCRRPDSNNYNCPKGCVKTPKGKKPMCQMSTENKSPCRLVCEDGYPRLQTFPDKSKHGNVCRKKDNTNYRCPRGCRKTTNGKLPFCRSFGNNKPCRTTSKKQSRKMPFMKIQGNVAIMNMEGVQIANVTSGENEEFIYLGNF